jgi:putative hemolysin
VVSIRKTRIQALLDEKRSGAQALAALRETPERFLATVQIGITVVSTAAAAFGGSSFAAHLAPLFARIPALAPFAETVAFAVVVATISYLSLVVGELVPKSLALRAGETYALIVAKPLVALSFVARPLVWFLTTSSNIVLRPFSDRTTFTEARLSKEELQQLVDEAAKAGEIDEHTSEIASRAIDFGKLTAADVMVPRNRIVALPSNASHEDVKQCLLEERRTRMPVYEGTLDNVVGYVTAKDILPLAWEGGLVVLRDVVRPVRLVPETTPVVELLQFMQHERQRLAIVLDEHGAVAGLATFEDVVEELVGEVFSEHDRTVDAVVHEPAGSLLVRGDVPLREVNRELDLPLDTPDGVTTIGGLCTHLAGGAIPQRGARLAGNDGLVLVVIGASPRAVRRVRIIPPPRLELAAEPDRAASTDAPTRGTAPS